MYCTKCGVELRNEDDRFCSRCGARTAVGTVELPTRTLMLDKRNRKIAGVCAGFARYLEVDVTLVRVLWLAIAVTTGVGFLAYLAAWLIMPSDYGSAAQQAPQVLTV
ncbi:MAG TPA: PspC domain-containing protein [Bryobacteraceae bacterium]|jgi:phage shock protein C